jgi:heterodisulfide reductase subunit C
VHLVRPVRIGLRPARRYPMGLRAAFRLYSKSAEMLARSGDALASCASCTGCEPLCPTGVPIARLVRAFAARGGGFDAARRDPTGSRR